jgi:hypothetical protein
MKINVLKNGRQLAGLIITDILEKGDGNPDGQELKNV